MFTIVAPNGQIMQLVYTRGSEKIKLIFPEEQRRWYCENSDCTYDELGDIILGFIRANSQKENS